MGDIAKSFFSVLSSSVLQVVQGFCVSLLWNNSFKSEDVVKAY